MWASLQRNAEENETAAAKAHCSVDVLALSWDDDEMLQRAKALGPFDLIVGGDLLYRPPVVAPRQHQRHGLQTPCVLRPSSSCSTACQTPKATSGYTWGR